MPHIQKRNYGETTMPYNKKAYQKRKKREYMKAYNKRKKKNAYMKLYNAWKRALKKDAATLTKEEAYALKHFKRTRFPKNTKPSLLLGKTKEYCGCGDHACGKDHEMPSTHKLGSMTAPVTLGSLDTLLLAVQLQKFVERIVVAKVTAMETAKTKHQENDVKRFGGILRSQIEKSEVLFGIPGCAKSKKEWNHETWLKRAIKRLEGYPTTKLRRSLASMTPERVTEICVRSPIVKVHIEHLGNYKTRKSKVNA
jgi:hypothetical protein